MQGERHEGTVPRTRALIVNDDHAVSLLLALVAEELGLDPLVAETGEEACRLLDGSPYGLIISDSLAGASAPWTWLDKLRAHQEALAARTAGAPAPVLLVSAHHPTVFAAYHEHGVAGVMEAPFDLDELAARVRGLLGTPS
jgi:DNA-binding response OmpR family regulator